MSLNLLTLAGSQILFGRRLSQHNFKCPQGANHGRLKAINSRGVPKAKKSGMIGTEAYPIPFGYRKDHLHCQTYMLEDLASATKTIERIF